MDKEENLRGYLNRIIETTEELSEQKIKDDSKEYFLPKRSYFLTAERYLRLFLEKKLNQRIVLIPGLRGIGKTTILFQIYNHLLKTKGISKERMIYIDAGDLINNFGGDIKSLFKVYEEIYLKNSLEKTTEPIFIFIDEAHYDSDWPSFTKSLFDRSDGNKNVLVFVSGSSALALKSNTDLSRRLIPDHLYPLSFQEYLLLKHNFYPPKGTAEKIRISLDSEIDSAYHILKGTYDSLLKNFTKKGLNIERELIEFMSLGASPMSVSASSADLYFRWWIGVLDKVIKQDIPSFSPLSQRNSPHLFGLLNFLAESSPSTHSMQSIAKKLDEVSKSTVFNIFEALKNACLLLELKPDKDQLVKTTASSKYYFAHPSIRATLLWNIGKFNKDPMMNDSFILGNMFEGLLASTFLRNKNIGNKILEVLFDSQKGSADFVLKTPSRNIAVECGWGRKTPIQIDKTMKRFKCKFGIKISKTNLVSKKDKIINVPRELLLFI